MNLHNCLDRSHFHSKACGNFLIVLFGEAQDAVIFCSGFVFCVVESVAATRVRELLLARRLAASAGVMATVASKTVAVMAEKMRCFMVWF